MKVYAILMRAAIWAGGEPPCWSKALKILSEADLIIAVDSAIDQLWPRGAIPHILIGDSDSSVLDWSKLTLNSIIRLPKNKDDSDTEAAIKLALSRGAEQIDLIGGSGYRMDHWLANLSLVRRIPEIYSWLTHWEEIRILNSGSEINISSGTVSVFALIPGIVKSQGFQWDLDGVDFKSWHSLSNVALASARLKVVEGRYMVLIPFSEVRDVGV